MMQIPYIEPVRSHAEIDKANDLVASMKALIAVLTEAGLTPDNKYALLDKEARQKLLRLGFAETLVNNVAFFTEQVRVPHDGDFVEREQFMVGFTSNAFDSNLYASDAIKTALIKSHSGRCAYCETLINQTAYGDVEHFRPKAAYETSWSPALFRPGYYSLAYEPRNLFYSCQLCNEAYKKNYFDVIGQRAPEVAVSDEVPTLIDPYLEDPRTMLRFNPMNGHAYPFDLVASFYAATQGWGTPQTSAEIWKDPSRIPDQRNLNGVSISAAPVNAAFGKWLSQQTNQTLRRGTSTINTLGLNRPALVRARVNHLRQLRAMSLATTVTGPEQAAAVQLMNTLGTGGPGSALLAPEYLSLGIDAAQTWAAQGAGSGAWIDNYNAILQAFVPEETEVVPPPHNDALSYLLLDDEVHLAGRRRLVYISSSDKVYGNPQGRRGISLAVDWAEELGNHVLIGEGKAQQKMTLADLLRLLDGNNSGYTLFRNSEVWVLGDFPPLRSN